MDGQQAWSTQHGGVRLSPPVRVWLGIVQGIARTGPVSRIPPDALSAAGVLCAAGAVGAAAAGGAWPLLAALLAVLTGLLDGLDGAVALQTGKARPLGEVVDATADRLGDLAFAAVLLVLGAPPALCAAAAALVLLHEYVRARAQGAGMHGPGAVTVQERPTRVIVVAVAALGTGLFPAGTPWTGWSWASVCAVGWVVVGVAGLVHLGAGVRRELGRRAPGQAGPTSPATIDADSATSGSPPPGCAEPPTR